MKNKWEKFLSQEISIEYKGGIYSLCHLFYCACYLIWQQTFSISLLQIAQITLFSYIICNLQVYVFKNFDEWDKLTAIWWLYASVCTLIYLVVAWLFNWFDGYLLIWLGFGMWQLFCYVCIYLVNKIKRQIDSKHLNNLLKTYKERR